MSQLSQNNARNRGSRDNMEGTNGFICVVSDEVSSLEAVDQAGEVRVVRRNRLLAVGRYRLVYIIFYLLGMITLLPWNFFITAEMYWMFKLRDINASTIDSSSQGVNANGTDALESRNKLQTLWGSYLSVASMLPNTLFLMLNALFSHRIRQEIRLIGSLSLIIVLFILTTIFVEVNTDLWQMKFLVITLVTVVFLNMAGAIFQGGLFGVAGKFPVEFINAVMSGQALGGIFASVCNIIAIFIGASPKRSAFIYFLVADVTLVFSFGAYLVMKRLSFFKYYVQGVIVNEKDVQSQLKSPISSGEMSSGAVTKVSHVKIVQRIWVYCFSIFLVFLVTLSVFPAVCMNIVSMHKGNGNLWNDVYFIPVVCFLVFNVGDYMGRAVAGWIKQPTAQSRWRIIVPVLCAMRVVFIPVFIYCNIEQHSVTSTVFNMDAYYVLFMIVFSVSNGYLANISFMFAPKLVSSYEEETAASVMAAFLGLGLALGALLSQVVTRLV